MSNWYVFLARKQLKFFWKQTVACVVGIAVGITAILVILSFSQGIQDFLGERILLLTPHLTLEAGINDQVTDNLQSQIDSVAGVQASSPYVLYPGLIQKGLAAEPVTIKGVEWNSEDRLHGISALLESGDWDQIRTGQGIVIGAELARMLGVGVGDAVTVVTPVHAAPLAVDGVFYTGYYGADAGVVMMPINLAQSLTEMTGFTGYGVRVRDFANVDQYILPLQEKTNLWVRPWYQKEQDLFISITVQRTVLVWILVFAMLVSALGIMNVFLMRSWSQQRSVGVLRTLGASPSHIGALFLMQGIYCGGLGGIIGLISARILVYILSLSTIRVPQVFYLEHLPIAWASGDVLWVLALAICIGFAAVVWPAWRMTRVDPVEVMRGAN